MINANVTLTRSLLGKVFVAAYRLYKEVIFLVKAMQHIKNSGYTTDERSVNTRCIVAIAKFEGSARVTALM